MEATTFFPGAVRRVVLGPPSMLLGANKSRRIRIAVKMPLSGNSLLGMPDWLGEAYTAVAKHFPHVDPGLKELIDISVSFSDTAPNQALFENPSAKAPSSELRGFEVLRVGESENPEVELQFTLYCSFSRQFWTWAGEKAGDEVHMFFPATKTGIKIVPPELPLDAATDYSTEDRPELGPEHDAEFAGITSDPSLEDSFGASASPEPAAPKKRAAKQVKSGKTPKPGARRSLTVN